MKVYLIHSSFSKISCSNPTHQIIPPQEPLISANTPSIVRLDSSNRTSHPSTTVVKDHMQNSINSQPLTSTSLAPSDQLSINSKLNHNNAAEERLRKRLKKAKQAVRKRRPRWLKVTMQNFSTFCNQTSLHGWQYIAQSHTSSLKHVFWALIVSLSMATAAIFLYNNTMDYLHATVRVLDVIICKHVVCRFPNISFLLFAYPSSLNLFQGGIKQTIVFVDIANRCDKEYHQQRLSCELNLLFVFLQNVTEKI